MYNMSSFVNQRVANMLCFVFLYCCIIVDSDLLCYW